MALDSPEGCRQVACIMVRVVLLDVDLLKENASVAVVVFDVNIVVANVIVAPIAL